MEFKECTNMEMYMNRIKVCVQRKSYEKMTSNRWIYGLKINIQKVM